MKIELTTEDIRIVRQALMQASSENHRHAEDAVKAHMHNVPFEALAIKQADVMRIIHNQEIT